MDFYTNAAGGELGTLALGLILAGVVGGLVRGLLGLGGGIVIVPILYHVLALIGIDADLRMHMAIGTSLATLIPTSVASLRPHAADTVDCGLLRRWSVPMAIGVLAGTALSAITHGRALALVFAVAVVPIALDLVFAGEDRKLADNLPTGAPGLAIPVVIGGLSTMMGVGGGAIGVPVMSLGGMPIQRAASTALSLGAIISVLGTIAAVFAGWHAARLPPYSLGYVNLPGFALIAPASFLAAPVGARLAETIDRKRLRMVFALFVAIIAARMVYDALT